MDKIRKTIITYYDNYKKEHKDASVPELLDGGTYNRLNKLNNKSIRFNTLENWNDSNENVKNIKKYAENKKNKIPLNELKEILNNDELANIYNNFQEAVFNLYEYHENDDGISEEKYDEMQNIFEYPEKYNKKADNIIIEKEKKENENKLKTLEETKNKQIEKILKDKEISEGLHEKEKEEIKKQSAEKTEKIASKIKNKKEDEIKKMQEKINKQQEELDEIKFKPMLKNYIDEKVKNSSYSLDKEQLINIIKKDIEDNKLPRKSDAEKIYNDIKSKATEYIVKNLSRIKKLSVLTGYNNDLFNKLPPEIATIVQEEMNNKIQEDIRKKNRKYILPKDLPRWERAVQQHNVNPMLGRGAWSN